MASEQFKDFNKRLSQWVASQGFWFQVRYSLAGTGMKGRATFHLMRMVFQLVVFVVLLGLISWAFLLKRTESGGFAEGIKEKLKVGIAGKELALRGLTYSQGQLEIPRLAAEGSNQSFFQTMELVTLRCKMGLLDGLVGVWDPGVISIARMDLDLRAGTDDDEQAAALAKVLFDESKKVRVNTFEIGNVNIRWGYSERTQGGIQGSALLAQRTNDGWRLKFRGGKFRQNWLRDLDVEQLVVVCEPDGIRFESAEFSQGGGRVDFSGLRVIAGSRPEIKGEVNIDRLNLEALLPEAASEFIQGTLSVKLKAYGSTNNSEGIRFEGQVIMDGEDVITLRDRLPVLTALSVMDYSRKYHRIDFREGAFNLKIGGGGMEVSDLSLTAADFFTLDGNMSVRLPTQDEIEMAIAQGRARRGTLGLEEENVNPYGELLSSDAEFSLQRAAVEAKRERLGQSDPDSYTLFDRLSFNAEMRTLEVAASERMSRMLQYEGGFRVSIPGDAFERAAQLQETYPADPATGRISIDVPLEGHLYELTEKQAQQIYERGRRL